MGGVIKGVYGVKYEDIRVYGMGLGLDFWILNFGDYDIEIYKGLWFF